MKPTPPMIGVAVSPAMKAKMDQHTQAGSGELWWSPLPVLVDPRLSDLEGFAYYREEDWRARCAEQREWDAAHNPPSAIRNPQ